MLAEMPEIGVVVTLHREGLLAAATLASAFEAAEFARVKGKTVRLLAVLDQPDAVTRSVLESWRHGLDVLEVVSGDVGLNRNAAVAP